MRYNICCKERLSNGRSTKIYLQKYGFSYDQIDLLGDSVISADENQIIFDENKIKNVKDPITMELVSRYL